MAVIQSIIAKARTGRSAVAVAAASAPAWTRPCRGCKDSSLHNAHLTLWGRIYFRWLA